MTPWYNTALFCLVTALDFGLTPRAEAAAQPQEAIILHYGVAAERNIQLLPQLIADQEGFFAREGIKFEPVPFTSSADPMQNNANLWAALKSGEIQVALKPVTFLMSEVQKGSNFVAVASGMANPVYILVAAKDVRSYADLKGKAVALTHVYDPITLTTRKLMRTHGLNDADIEIKYIPGSGNRFDCVKAGECAAASLTQSVANEALAEGYSELGISNEVVPLVFNVEIVERSWAATHRDLVAKYIRALAAAASFFYDPGSREKVVRIAVEYTGQPEDHVRQTLAYLWDPRNHAVAQRAEIDLQGLAAMVATVAEFGALAAPIPSSDQLIDLSYWEAAGVQ